MKLTHLVQNAGADEGDGRGKGSGASTFACPARTIEPAPHGGGGPKQAGHPEEAEGERDPGIVGIGEPQIQSLPEFLLVGS